MEKPKIVAVKHKQLAVPARAPLTELEKNLAEAIRKRGETLPKELEEQLLEESELHKQQGIREEMREQVALQAKENEVKEAEKETEMPKESENKKATNAEEKPGNEEMGTETQSKAEPEKEATQPKVEPTKQEPAKQEPLEQQKGQAKEAATQLEPKAQKPKPKIVAKNEYAPAGASRQGVSKMHDDIVRQVRRQASTDILQVRKEIGKPVQARVSEHEPETELAREIEEEADPRTKKKTLVDEAIKKFEEKEGEKSFVKRLMRKIGFK